MIGIVRPVPIAAVVGKAGRSCFCRMGREKERERERESDITTYT